MRVTKKHILSEIRSHYRIFSSEIGKTALGKGQIHLECWHGDCERIGQFVLRTFSKQVYTYFACHEFRKGTLSIYFKR